MDEINQEIYGFPAAVRVAQIDNRDALLELARKRAMDATIFDEHDPFFWGAIISNTRLDSYWTHMARSSLVNYAADAADGVSFQNSHKWYELPIGASLTGRVEELEGGLVQVTADFYTLDGLQLTNLSTEQFIRGVRSGVLKDVSIGFSRGTYKCDLCGQNYMRCQHWAGMQYEVEDQGVMRTLRCTVTIEDARLSEVSAVYDGATPGAVILKARAAAADGRLRGKEAEQLEQMYRVAIPVTRHFEGVDTPGQAPRKADRMNAEQFTQLTSTLIRAGVLSEEQRETATEAEALAAADKLAKRIEELTPQAADGRAYRSDLVAEALAEGVRAYGKDFDEPMYRSTLEVSPLPVIKRMRDDWKRIGDARLPAGRTSADEGDERAVVTTPLVPDFAYQS